MMERKAALVTTGTCQAKRLFGCDNWDTSGEVEIV